MHLNGWLWGTIPLLLLTYTLYRVLRKGYRLELSPRRLFSYCIGFLCLLGAVLVAHWFIKRNTPPEHMSVLEAQAMDMSVMRPPKGAAPVAVFTARYMPFNATLRYAANAVAYQEELLSPRVNGVLVWMPYYPGMVVRKGQLLARLDTAELREKEASAAAGLKQAERALLEAQAQGHQAQIAVGQAQAMVMQAQEQEKEAQADLDVAQKELMAHHEEANIAQAALDSANAGKSEAQSRLEAARASLSYWKRQVQRDEDLLAKGFLAQQQAQQDRVELQNAQAELSSAQSRLQQVEATIRSSQAQLRKVQIGLQQGETLITQKQAALKVAQSQKKQALLGVQAAQTALEASKETVERQQAAVAQAKAQLREAQVVLGYTALYAQNSGVVTERLISPGTLVQPGETILKVAQFDPIRVQAQVSQEDAECLHMGALVKILFPNGERYPILTHITDIFPSADPNAHTVIAEAIVPNPQAQIRPGDYLTMQIVYEQTRRALVVPSTAVVYQPQPTSPILASKATPAVWVMRRGGPMRVVYTCTMHPQVQLNHPGKCPICGWNLVRETIGGEWQAHLHPVRIGGSNGLYTQILSGIREGDRVIYEGYVGLHDGDKVIPVPWSAQGPSELPEAAQVNRLQGETLRPNSSMQMGRMGMP